MRSRVVAQLLLLIALLWPIAVSAQTWQWARFEYGGGGNTLEKLTTDTLGNSYMVGRLNDSLTLGGLAAYGLGLYVASLDAQGQGRWVSKAEINFPPFMQSPPDFFPGGIVADGRGRVYVTGLCAANTRFGALRLPALADTSREVMFVACLDAATGAWQWATAAQSANDNPASLDQLSNALTSDAAGQLYLTGLARGGGQFGAGTLAADSLTEDAPFVASCTPSGNWRWVARAPANSPMNSLLADANGHLFLNGILPGRLPANDSSLVTTPGVPGEFTTFVARLDASSGALQWVRLTGEWYGGNMAALPMRADVRGELLVMGRVRETTRFDGLEVPATPFGDNGGTYFRGRLSSTGRWRAVAPLPIPPSYISLSVPQSSWYTIQPVVGIFTRRGELVVGGHFNDSTLTIGPYRLYRTGQRSWVNADIFVASFDSAGVCLGAVQAGGRKFDAPHALAEGAAGQLYCAAGLVGDSTTYGAITLGSPPNTSSAIVARLDGLLPAPLAGPAPLAATPLSLYPNPAHDRVTVRGAPGQPIRLVNALGRVVRQPASSPDVASLDLRGLAPGLYLVRVGAATRRLVVE